MCTARVLCGQHYGQHPLPRLDETIGDVTPAELDALLDGRDCRLCGRPYRWCECWTLETPGADIPAEDVALDVSSAWFTRDNMADIETGLRVWARYRRAQDRL